MKIAQIAPLCESVPPRTYGGTERVVSYLTDALVELGCDVTLFASAEARTLATLVPMRDRAIRLDPIPLKCEWAAHLTMLKRVQQMADRFDVLHFHLDPLHFAMFEHMAPRTLTTLHGRLDVKDYGPLVEAWPQYPLVSISLDQRLPLARANWVGNVPHGIPHGLYRPMTHAAGRYLAFLGRLSPEKGPDVAIRVAKRARLPLKIAAKVDDVDTDYFRKSIRPLLNDPLIEFIGEIGEADKRAFLGGALALLFPIDWPEPFGLVMIEAMACGTPVIAWNRGSVPEVIDDGITGRIVDSEQQALDAVEWARLAERACIRQVFERRFCAHTMARHYLDIYRHRMRGKLEVIGSSAVASVAVAMAGATAGAAMGGTTIGGAAVGGAGVSAVAAGTVVPARMN